MKWLMTLSIVVLLAVMLAACGTPTTPAAEPTAAPEPTQAAVEPTAELPTETPANTLESTTVPTDVPVVTIPAGALVSLKAADAPKLDGVGDKAMWQDAAEVTIAVAGGANNGSTTVGIKSVYTADSVCFPASWADPTESWLRAP